MGHPGFSSRVSFFESETSEKVRLSLRSRFRVGRPALSGVRSGPWIGPSEYLRTERERASSMPAQTMVATEMEPGLAENR